MPVASSKRNTFSITNPSFILRFGLAFVFAYAAIFVSGDAAIGAKYIPAFITHIIPVTIFLPMFGVFEVFLALWLLSGKFARYAGLVTAGLLMIITLLNLSFFETIFRNVAIITAALALSVIDKNE